MSLAPDIHHFTCHARLDQLQTIMDWARQQAHLCGLSAEALRKLELALEEALVNVMQHAYADGKGTIELTSHAYLGQRIELIIRDKGPPFNPLLQEPRIDRRLSLEERQEGGLGIILMRRYVDNVLYERQHPYNILTLIKSI